MMELGKNDSKMLQGLSVLAMLCLHLFDREYEGLFHPILFVGGGTAILLLWTACRLLCIRIRLFEWLRALCTVQSEELL